MKRIKPPTPLSYEQLTLKDILPKSKVSLECKCGNIRLGEMGMWRAKRYKACKSCMKKIKSQATHERFSKGKEGLKNRLFGAYVSSANIRGIPFELTREDFFSYTHKQCHYCHVAPLTKASKRCGREPMNVDEYEFLYNGVDRIDNSKGYTKENCITCCGQCNKAKNMMSYDEYLEFIFRLRAGGVTEETRLL